MSTSEGGCPQQWCIGGACDGARLDSLLIEEARWLWEQLAARADRSGEPSMTGGTTVITAPAASGQRAAVLGLVGSRILAPGERRRIRLEELTLRLRQHGDRLTPGAVAAHAAGRALGSTAAERALQLARTTGLRKLRSRLADGLPGQVRLRPVDETWEELHRTGRVARILQHPAPEQLLKAAAEVLRLLPPHDRIDRRLLAFKAAGDPHGLDAGTDLAGLVLAEAAAAGLTTAKMPPRAAWGILGVDLDRLGGGLLSLGVHPDGWQVPIRFPFVLPPATLTDVHWPAPPHEGSWVFVTENPSVTTAALELPPAVPVRLLCTVGTPSATELDTLARLADSGWNIAVRADFDASGIGHMRAALRTVPRARPWRMSTDDYVRSLHPTPFQPTPLDTERLPETEWDPALRTVMCATGRPAYEEALLDGLLDDIRSGHPHPNP
ncbi:DUF2399 domain-containing protein [Streptomyces sp. NPDC090052]|uniref:DUF2399 domain-containing protein n=1 Tax=unclassified Streptomyces TaxID=2593676 RepID=UPI00382E262A|nr:DUF2399 domain-containing protein [Streptomyces sp. NBC_01180]